MKKLMILTAIAVASVAVQAADIKWGARNIYIPTVSDVTKSQTGIIASSGDKFAANALTVALFWVDSNGADVSIGSFATTGDGVISAQVLGSGTSSELYQAMVADQGTDWKPQYHYTATYTTANGTYEYSGTSSATKPIGNLSSTAISLTSDFSTTGTWNYTAASVPEPTSGLLLLLGMAGMALKRKRA